MTAANPDDIRAMDLAISALDAERIDVKGRRAEFPDSN